MSVFVGAALCAQPHAVLQLTLPLLFCPSAMFGICCFSQLLCRRKRKRAAEEKNQKLKSPNFAVSSSLTI
jgi:hypothetical protein